MIFSRVVKTRSEMGTLSSLALSIVLIVPFLFDLSVAGPVMMGMTGHCTLKETDRYLQQVKLHINFAQQRNGLFVVIWKSKDSTTGII